MKFIPYGIDSFSEIRQGNYIYVDKTRLLYELVRHKIPYFLSRPRRFGKTLTVSSLKAILEGRRDLFKGLWIDSSDYDWRPYPVIHLSLSSVKTDSLDSVNKALLSRLKIIARREKLSFSGANPDNESSPDDVANLDDEDSSEIFFLSLIEALYYKYNRSRVAILIDEYDTPILSSIAKPGLANEIRQLLKKFYGVLKDSAEYRGFTFITGVTRLTKTSIFSDLNNLMDLTVNDDYAAICGLTLEEFDAIFQERLEHTLIKMKSKGRLEPATTVAELRAKILEWYDGYSWDGQTRVLNPWSLLNFFNVARFSNFWFKSGTPTFLVNLIRARRMSLSFFQADNYISEALNNVEVDNFEPGPLMFQTGYLTIRTDSPPKGENYNLVFPNLEVKASLAPLLLSLETPLEDQLLMKRQALAVKTCLFKRDESGFQAAFASFIANFPYQIQQAKEFFYQALFISAMALADQYFESELSVGGGRIDLHLKEPQGDDYVIEIKYREANENLEKKTREAFDQIEARKYHL
ncbi:MAG: ATP-binding protein, partial [Deltaproteobacteria bacterium]|nr:ATP-binding protein [Deltaproteobacteria bacterium]